MSAAPQLSPPARILDVTTEQYFADPCEIPSLSQSLARTLITQSPAHAWIQHPRLNTDPSTRAKSTPEQNEGTIIHSILLGKGADLDVIDADNYRTKKAQEMRDAAFAGGRQPILQRRYDELLKIAGTLSANIESFGIRFDGESEVAIEWREEGIEGDVLCRCRTDHFVVDRGTIYDIKKISSADAKTCSRHAVEYGYDIQWAANTSAAGKLLPEFAGRIDFVFLFCEVEPPYAVVPCRPDGALRELGLRRWTRAVNLWEHCLRADRWPSYTETITTLEAPPWAIHDEEKNNGEF